MSKKTRAIFTETELYNLCLAEVSAMRLKDETGYDFDWSECVPSNSEDYEEKFDTLSLADQNYFNDRLNEVAKNFRNDFDNLPDDIQDGVINGVITERHARALLSAPEEKQVRIYKDIVKKGLNVRETENYIESINQPKKVHARQKTKGYSKNIQIGINTVNQSIKMIEKLGIEVRVDTSETDDQVKMIISFPKK